VKPYGKSVFVEFANPGIFGKWYIKKMCPCYIRYHSNFLKARRCNKPIKDSTLQFSWFKKGEIIMETYENNVVIITGASEGIGRALSFEFAK